MSVDNYKSVEKVSIDELIERAIAAEYIISAAIEHYTIDELKELAKRAKKNDLVMTIKPEYSNFYQGVLIGFIKRKNLDKTFIRYI